MKNLLILCIALIALTGGIALPRVVAQDNAPSTTLTSDTAYLVRWMELLYDRVQRESRNVPQASRIYGYASLTAYEALRGGFPNAESIVERLTGQPLMPTAETSQRYDWLIVMNGALRVFIPGLMAPLSGQPDTLNDFNTAQSVATQRAVQALSDTQTRELAARTDRVTVAVSLAYGERIGQAMLDWAAADSFNDTRQMTAVYVPPTGDGLWTETTPGDRAMEPYWGELRPFTLNDATQCAMALDVPFDPDVRSTFHMQALEVRDMQRDLTDDQRVMAAYWDERVGESGTASGHWIMVQNGLTQDLNLSLEQAAEMYARVGVGMADAFIAAWSLKYQENLMRPETYIQTHIDPTWEPVRQAPPFPAYPSGHAVLGGTVAMILTDLFGPVAYTDRYGVRYGMEARRFTSFHAAAFENAISRMYAGVHWRVDMENGLEIGHCVGQQVIDRLN